jgi:hypothetical protein
MKRLVAYIFFAMIVSSTAYAMSSCKGENKRTLFKLFKWHKCIGSEKIDTHKYEGEYRYGKFDGHGTFFWSDDRKYIGKWKKGKKNGFGIYTSSDQQYNYEGEWQHDLKNGIGIVKDHNEIYSGIFINDSLVKKEIPIVIKDGEKIHTYPNGYKYDGNFKDGFKHGKGILISADNNEKYTGEWVYGFRDGEGALALYKSHSSSPYIFYKGEWKNDDKNGKGTEEYANGSMHMGNFINGKIEGDGTFIFPNNKKCIGNWKDGFVSLTTSDHKNKMRIVEKIKSLEEDYEWTLKKKNQSEEEQIKIKEEQEKIEKEISKLTSEIPFLSYACKEFIKE